MYMIVYIVLDKFKSVRYNVHVGDGTMLNTNITNFRKNIFSFFEQAIKYNESVSISTKDGNDSIRLSTIVCRKTKLNYKNWHRDLKNS